MSHDQITVIGGGLAGVEAAWQIAARGIPLTLVEMRPGNMSPAHHTADLAELVCSNSFKSDDPNTAAGVLKRELTLLGSVVLAVARKTTVPAGSALAVNRKTFSARLTNIVESHPLVSIDRSEADRIPQGMVVIATGPLTSTNMEQTLSSLVGSERLAFYDAASPIVESTKIDRSICFSASRYGKGEGADYLNCPLDSEQYERLCTTLATAEQVIPKDFEQRELFSACMPIEELAKKGPDAMRFGPLKPVGLVDPSTGERPYAVVQLRAENRARTAYNLVGFQTNLTFSEQRRILDLIPGLADTEIVRFGVMHRNTFVDAPRILSPSLQVRTRPNVLLAGQLTGTEGYLEAAATGLLAGVNVERIVQGLVPLTLPVCSVTGALLAYATDPATVDYQPMHVNFGIVPKLDPPVKGKRARYAAYSQRAITALTDHLSAASFQTIDLPVLEYISPTNSSCDE